MCHTCLPWFLAHILSYSDIVSGISRRIILAKLSGEEEEESISLMKPTMNFIRDKISPPPDILSDIRAGISSGILSGVLAVISCDIEFDISSAIPSDIHSDIPCGILSGVLAAISCDI